MRREKKIDAYTLTAGLEAIVDDASSVFLTVFSFVQPQQALGD